MERTVLHIDCNKFYASVECLYHPEYRDKPLAVGGSEEKRHGIILTKNEIAAKYNLYAGEPIWQARRKCPELIVVEPDFPLYMRFSGLVRKILEDYSYYIEPFGLDESWIDVTGDSKSGTEIAGEIRARVKEELGITVSIGVSFNKVFAKLGSDYKKPDAVTVISKENFKNIVFPLKCGALLLVGKATEKKLNYYGIYTIGDLANAPSDLLLKVLGKNGIMLKAFANGQDTSPVRRKDEKNIIKSVGNSVTSARDLSNFDDVKTVITVLSESVSRRMREHGLKGKTVCISVRDKNLKSFTRQCRMSAYSNISREIAQTACTLFKNNYYWSVPVRSVGVSVCDFDFEKEPVQFDFDKSVEHREKMQKLESAVDALKNRFGSTCIQPAALLKDKELSGFSPYDDHTVHPEGFFGSPV